MPASPFRQPWLRRLTRLLGWLLLLGYFAFALLVIALRYAVLPQINNYHDDIERTLSESLHLPVAIDRIEAEWQGLHPRLVLHDVQIRDRQKRSALALENVAADISWTSLLHFGLRLNRLEIVAPTLTIRRDSQGQIFVAGLHINAPQQESAFSAWLLAQKRVVVSNASITWLDELRSAPALTLQHLEFNLANDDKHHQFGMIADPPRTLASRLDIRGDLQGSDLDAWETWQGDAYAELDYADLSVWRTWIDYPLDLPQGSGGMRLWLSFADRQLTALTADIALADVKLSLATDLPQLDLQHLHGRLSGKRLSQGFEFGAKQLTLTTRDDVRIEPTDFRLRWSEASERAPAHGELTANGLDLGALSRLATHLPIEAASRQRLLEAAPQGKLFDLNASWTGVIATEPSAPLALKEYSVRARFERLGMQAMGALPGIEGLSGSIDGNQQGGRLILTSKSAHLDFPRIFADPRITLDALNAQLRWKRLGKGNESPVELKLEEASFENQDAAGSASGSYVARSGEAGEIDLQAHLTRAAGGAVWRYMPLVVGQGVRDWLHTSIIGGASNDTTLRLKGDLKRFPFADGSGVFEVKGKFHGPSLLYAQSWPQIDKITGDLAFVGKRMTIKASRGEMYGVTLSDVKAEIADLESMDELIVISGNAAGPTADFLRFVEASPVGEYIDHVTEDMTAAGNGQLRLKLALPLRRLADTKTDGIFQFTNNKLTVDPDLPQLTEVNGRLQFSGDGLKADRVRANLLGSPMFIDVKTAGNGIVLVNSEGTLNIADMRKQLAHPLLDHLSGSSPWRGRVRIRKKNAEVSFESKLQGISSSLPEPFNKGANEALPLRFERKLLVEPPRPAVNPTRRATSKPLLPERPIPAPVPRDQIDATLGNVLAARFVRRHEGARAENTVWERAALAIGEPLVLPDNGLLVALNLKKIDVDFWRAMFAGSGGESGNPATTTKLPKVATSVVLKSRELIGFGHVINDLEIRAGTIAAANERDGGWRADVKSRDLSGELYWLNHGAGRLSARLKQLAINGATGSKTAHWQAGSNALEKLPGLDIEAEQFSMRNKPYGKLKLIADNRDGTWEAKLNIENEDGKLTGEGNWRPSPSQPDTHLKFSLNVTSIEKLLARLGYPDTLRRGSASLEGAVSWNGAPFEIDYPSLNGTLKVEAENGQFNKLEPGVGRLLGILSLQSLPRRITLDFRDIFSQGLAFDNINGQVTLNRGVMDTQNFKMSGPSAKIFLSGSINLPMETQNLKVRVSPALGETLAVGAMLAHPAAGAIAWLADKVLKNPIDQIFSYDYAVTGSWADPKVEKLSAQKARTENAEKP